MIIIGKDTGMMRIFISIFFLLISSAFADSLTVYDYTAGTFVNTQSTSTNYDSGDTVRVQYNAITGSRYGLLQFPTIYNDTIPDSAVISACSLTFKISTRFGISGSPINIFCLVKPAISSQVTYTLWKTSYGWGSDFANSVAGNCDTNDFNESNNTGYDVNQTDGMMDFDTVGSYTVPVDTCHVYGWITNNSRLCGFTLKVHGATVTNVTIDETVTPTLRIWWDIPATGTSVTDNLHETSKFYYKHSKRGRSNLHGK